LEAERQRALARAAGLRRDLDAVVEAAALDPPDDEHDPEGATVGFERAMTLDLLRQAEADLAGLDEALARVAGGSYGVCTACGGPIGAERLAAHPAATTCVECAQASAAAISSRVRPTLKAGDPGSMRRPSASEPTS
jgi:DnaK suppressor protein